LGHICSAVLTFIGYKQTNKHPDRQAKFIDRRKNLRRYLLLYRALS